MALSFLTLRLCVILLMVQKSQGWNTVWMGEKTLVNNGISTTKLNWWVDPGFLIAINPIRHPKDFSPRHPKAHTQVPGGHSSAGPGKPFGTGDFEKSNPWKINVERKNGSFGSDDFPFSIGWFWGSMLHFRGVHPWTLTVLLAGKSSCSRSETHRLIHGGKSPANLQICWIDLPLGCEISSENHRRMTRGTIFRQREKNNPKPSFAIGQLGGLGGRSRLFYRFFFVGRPLIWIPNSWNSTFLYWEALAFKNQVRNLYISFLWLTNDVLSFGKLEAFSLQPLEGHQLFLSVVLSQIVLMICSGRGMRDDIPPSRFRLKQTSQGYRTARTCPHPWGVSRHGFSFLSPTKKQGVALPKLPAIFWQKKETPTRPWMPLFWGEQPG